MVSSWIFFFYSFSWPIQQPALKKSVILTQTFHGQCSQTVGLCFFSWAEQRGVAGFQSILQCLCASRGVSGWASFSLQWGIGQAILMETQQSCYKTQLTHRGWLLSAPLTSKQSRICSQCSAVSCCSKAEEENHVIWRLQLLQPQLWTLCATASQLVVLRFQSGGHQKQLGNRLQEDK